jgi:hypothetical protein
MQMSESPWARLFSFCSSRPQQLQVYVAARPFTSFGGDLMKRLPHEAKALLVDIGVCHYMVSPSLAQIPGAP